MGERVEEEEVRHRDGQQAKGKEHTPSRTGRRKDHRSRDGRHGHGKERARADRAVEDRGHRSVLRGGVSPEERIRAVRNPGEQAPNDSGRAEFGGDFFCRNHFPLIDFPVFVGVYAPSRSRGPQPAILIISAKVKWPI